MKNRKAIGPNGENVLVDVVFHDSCEISDKERINRMTSIRLDSACFHRAGDDWREAVEWALGKLALKALGLGMRSSPMVPLTYRAPAASRSEAAGVGSNIGEAVHMPRDIFLTVVISSYAEAFEIDWDSVVSPLSKASRFGLNLSRLDTGRLDATVIEKSVAPIFVGA